MGRRSSLHVDFVHVNTLNGLEAFQIFFFSENFTNFDLNHQEAAETYSTVGQILSIIFLPICSN